MILCVPVSLITVGIRVQGSLCYQNQISINNWVGIQKLKNVQVQRQTLNKLNLHALNKLNLDLLLLTLTQTGGI